MAIRRIETIKGGSGVTVDVTDPSNPTINGTAASSGFSKEPILDFNSMNVSLDDNYLKSTAFSKANNGNLFPFSTGDIPLDVAQGSSGAVTTLRYALGDYGKTTATRVQITSTGANKYQTFVYETLPAGTYTFSAKIKSNVGAGVQTVSFGDYSHGIPAITIDEVAYVKYSHTFTLASDAVCWFMLLATANADVLIDEFQLYEASVTPVYNPEISFDVLSSIALKSKVTKSGNAIVPDAGGFNGGFALPSYPDLQTIDEMTFIAVVKSTEDVQIAGKVLSSDGAGGVFDIGVDTGNAYGLPALDRAESAGLRITNDGYHVIASRFGVADQAFFFNNLKHTWNTNTLSLSKSMMGFSGDPLTGGYAFQGNITNALVFDTALTDVEMLDRIDHLKARHKQSGEVAVRDTFNFLISEGDSITDGDSYFNRYFTARVSNVFGTNIAVYGSAIADANLRLPNVLLQIAQAKEQGYSPIVSLFIGTNDLYNITFAQLSTYWAAVRGAGAKVIVATLLPRSYNVVSADWDTFRNALNTEIRNASAEYDGIFDWDTQPLVGGDLAADLTDYYSDGLHPNSAGQDLMKLVVDPVIESVLV